MSAEIGRDLNKACQLLERGIPIGIPTETVYGLAANAYDANAVRSIFRIKNRPFFDPLIVHCSGVEKLSDVVREVPDWAMRLAETFWPGPITFILPKHRRIPDVVTSGLPNVAVRVPAHPLALDLLGQLDFPLAAPSANPFGYVSPTTAKHVSDQLGESIAYILDGGECSVGIESTIVSANEGIVSILRLGGISLEAIEEALSQHVSVSKPTGVVPGSLESHYAPFTPLTLGPVEECTDASDVAVLCFSKRREDVPIERQVVLSPDGDIAEAATNLFSALRYLDSLGMSRIVAEELPDVGIGRAVNDRLRRASAKRGMA